jgi:two-component system, NarL family, response regulator NreC
MTIRIVIDDDAVVRKQLAVLLESHAGWQVCGEAENGPEAVVKTTELKPHLIILDLSMPGMDGFHAAREIATIMLTVPILIYTEHNYWEIELEAQKYGVRRVVLRTGDGGELFSAIETIFNSERRGPGLEHGVPHE